MDHPRMASLDSHLLESNHTLDLLDSSSRESLNFSTELLSDFQNKNKRTTYSPENPSCSFLECLRLHSL